MKIGAAICLCEQDAYYLPPLFNEIERMDVDVAWLLNNCSQETIEKINNFPRTVGSYIYNGSFHNCLRQYPLDILKKEGYEWCIQWDADETWEPNASQKLRKVLKDQKMITVKMAHIWQKEGRHYITTDWASERDRIYNLHYDWVYLSRVVAGATLLGVSFEPEIVDVWMIHWGYMTQTKRLQHKARWDANHGKSVGKNPYGQWKTITEEGYEPHLTLYTEFIKTLK